MRKLKQAGWIEIIEEGELYISYVDKKLTQEKVKELSKELENNFLYEVSATYSIDHREGHKLISINGLPAKGIFWKKEKYEFGGTELPKNTLVWSGSEILISNVKSFEKNVIYNVIDFDNNNNYPAYITFDEYGEVDGLEKITKKGYAS